MRLNNLSCLILAFMFLAVGCHKKPTGKETPLHRAAKAGDIKQVKTLLSRGADVNSKDENTWASLHYASKYGHRNMAELLLANGAEVNIKDYCGITPLHEAACKGQKDLVELLLDKGADINGTDNSGDTPLKCAAENGHLDVTEFLISKGATIDMKNLFGETPEWRFLKRQKPRFLWLNWMLIRLKELPFVTVPNGVICPKFSRPMSLLFWFLQARADAFLFL